MNLPSRHTGSSNRFKVVVLVLLMVVLVVPVVVVVVRIGSPSSGSSSRGRSTSISTHSSSSSSTPAWPNSPACRLGLPALTGLDRLGFLAPSRLEPARKFFKTARGSFARLDLLGPAFGTAFLLYVVQ